MTEWWNRAVMEEKVRIILEKYEKNFNATMYDADSKEIKKFFEF